MKKIIVFTITTMLLLSLFACSVQSNNPQSPFFGADTPFAIDEDEPATEIPDPTATTAPWKYTAVAIEDFIILDDEVEDIDPYITTAPVVIDDFIIDDEVEDIDPYITTAPVVIEDYFIVDDEVLDLDIDLSNILVFNGQNEAFEAYLVIIGDEFLLGIEQGEGEAVAWYCGVPKLHENLLDSEDEDGTLFGFDGELLITEDFGDFVMEIIED
ncbi:MAG: hypothetical protein FWH05_06830 [Oscillospiraceae bacterium]|nr:hypothetical protein [Oscillospiraceae bacterium]